MRSNFFIKPFTERFIRVFSEIMLFFFKFRFAPFSESHLGSLTVRLIRFRTTTFFHFIFPCIPIKVVIVITNHSHVESNSCPSTWFGTSRFFDNDFFFEVYRCYFGVFFIIRFKMPIRRVTVHTSIMRIRFSVCKEIFFITQTLLFHFILIESGFVDFFRHFKRRIGVFVMWVWVLACTTVKSTLEGSLGIFFGSVFTLEFNQSIF